MLIQQILEQNGVTAFVPGANAFSVMPHLAFSGEMRVMVSRDQLEYARQLYSAFFESDIDTDYDSQCGNAEYASECDGKVDEEESGNNAPYNNNEYDGEEF